MGHLLRLIWERPLVLLIVALGLAGFTSLKLYRMTQIRGWSPGAQVIEKTVTDKTLEPSRRGGMVYRVWWADQDGSEHVNMTESAWTRVRVGDAIRLIQVPGDNAYHLRDGIYASNENFVFDGVLLCAELGVVALALVRLRRKTVPVTT